MDRSKTHIEKAQSCQKTRLLEVSQGSSWVAILNKQRCHFVLFCFTNRRVEQVLWWRGAGGGVGSSGRREGVGGERVWEGGYSANTVYTYVNGKMIPVETIPGMEGEGDKEEWWRGEFKYDIL
jgi:hypothetical protein